jgi:hypothetical protein
MHPANCIKSGEKPEDMSKIRKNLPKARRRGSQVKKMPINSGAAKSRSHAFGSWNDLRLRLKKSPGSVTIFSDTQLTKISTPLPTEPIIAAKILGERLIRNWLYREHRSDCSGLVLNSLNFDLLWSAFEAKALPLHNVESISAHEIRERLHVDSFQNSIERDIWNHFIERLVWFLTCDGLIPACIGHGEALPIPFVLRADEAPSTLVRDINGVPAKEWINEPTGLWDALGHHYGIQLGCDLGAYAQVSEPFSGGSFALPVLLAHSRKQKADYPVMGVLATGEIVNRRVKAVDQNYIGAKQKLAHKMGVNLFVAPGIDNGNDVLSIPQDSPIKDALGRIWKRLDELGLTVLDAPTARLRLRELFLDVRLGNLPLIKARERLLKYKDALKNEQHNPVIAEELVRAQLLHGAIENHCGDPLLGKKLSDSARKLAGRSNPLLFFEAGAKQVVSLTDLGNISEAIALGRNLLRQLQSFRGNADDRLRAEMIIKGSLGGDALLSQALNCRANLSLKTECLTLLEDALARAQQLYRSCDNAQTRVDVCMDTVRLAMGHALLNPDNYEAIVEQAATTLNMFPIVAANTSRQYLRRVRFLGAYRAWIENGKIQTDFENWDLPDEGAGHFAWLRATALKYRGALYSSAGDLTSARSDFANACKLLDDQAPPILRFISATCALQAGECLLLHNDSSGKHYLLRSTNTFIQFKKWFCASIRGTRWLKRSQGLLMGVLPAKLPHPQLHYQY